MTYAEKKNETAPLLTDVMPGVLKKKQLEILIKEPELSSASSASG